MRFALLVAALSLTAIPAAANAQGEVPGGPESAATTYTMTDAQKALYDHFTVDRRTAYDAWTPQLQEMFWSLSAQQQRGWWVLTPTQREMVAKMTPENREKAFASVLAQLSAADGKPAGA